MKRLIQSKRAQVILFLLLAMTVTFLVLGYYSTRKLPVYQYRVSAEVQHCEVSTIKSEQFCTHLPLVIIDTSNSNINETRDTVGSIRLVNNENGHNHFDGIAALESHIRIKAEDIYFSDLDKKQYKITLVDANDDITTISQSVLGMPAESEWILDGMATDMSLLRNYLMHNLADEIMAKEWTPQVQYCELFLNGEYQGIYLMSESVKVAPNRLNIIKTTEQSATTGYLLKREQLSDANNGLVSFGIYAKKTFGSLIIIYPDKDELTAAQEQYILNEVSSFEKALYSLDYDNSKDGYAKWIDVRSFVDYFIINEFALNFKAEDDDTYIYKNVGGKLEMGPVWSFDNSYNNYMIYDLHDVYIERSNWYNMLVRDDAFVELIIKRYHDLRKNILKEDRIIQMIDNTVEWLGPAIDRNFEVWGDLEDEKLSYDSDQNSFVNGQTFHNHEEALKQLKVCIVTRGEFLDEYIVILRQFSAESAVKEWNN